MHRDLPEPIPSHAHGPGITAFWFLLLRIVPVSCPLVRRGPSLLPLFRVWSAGCSVSQEPKALISEEE